MAKIGPRELELRAKREARAGRKAPKPPRAARLGPKPVTRKGGKPSKPPQRSKKRPFKPVTTFGNPPVAALENGPTLVFAGAGGSPLKSSLPVPKKLGRPSTGFDRTSYQRVYTRLRRQYGPKSAWPAEALSQLRAASTPQLPTPL